MFDFGKQLEKIKELKGLLEKEKREVKKEGVKVVVNGKMEIEDIELNSQLDLARQEKLVKECLNQALRQLKEEMVKKML